LRVRGFAGSETDPTNAMTTGGSDSDPTNHPQPCYELKALWKCSIFSPNSAGDFDLKKGALTCQKAVHGHFFKSNPAARSSVKFRVDRGRY